MKLNLPYTESVNYQLLLEHALESYDSFSLVWRSGFKFKKSAKEFEESLKPFLHKEESKNSWPGTETEGEPSLVSEYLVTVESIRLLSVLKHPWCFEAPKFPEDLAFYKNGKVVFASVAHERMFWYENA